MLDYNTTPDNIAQLPPIAWALGLLGLIPFLLPAGLAVLGHPQWLGAQHAYAACILAFLGALHWGPALSGINQRQPALLLTWGVVPSLIAWVALSFAGSQAAYYLCGGLVLAYGADVWLARYHRWPQGYLRLRGGLTSVACLSLLAPALA